jgi:Uma2 family endonuclease
MSSAPPSIPTIFPPLSGDGGSLPSLTVAEYHQLGDDGVLAEDVELLEGLVVKKMPKNPRHVAVTRRVRRLLETMFKGKCEVNSQDPVTFSASEPEPDVVLVRGTEEDYAQKHPVPTDVGLIVEVSESTLHRDRGVKKRIYAKASIPVYWIVNLVNNQIEVYTQPSGPTVTPDYAGREIVDADSQLPVILDGTVAGTLAVKDILG